MTATSTYKVKKKFRVTVTYPRLTDEELETVTRCLASHSPELEITRPTTTFAWVQLALTAEEAQEIVDREFELIRLNKPETVLPLEEIR